MTAKNSMDVPQNLKGVIFNTTTGLKQCLKPSVFNLKFSQKIQGNLKLKGSSKNCLNHKINQNKYARNLKKIKGLSVSTRKAENTKFNN